jgi:hypothetical protein
MKERKGYPNSYLYETSREHYVNMRIGRKRKPFSEIHMQRLIESAQKEKNNFYGRKHTEESKQKQREKMVGKYGGENSPFYGRTHTEEAKKKISLTHKGKKLSKEQVESIRENMKDTIFINDGSGCKRIKKDQPIPEGWVRGRLKENSMWINNGIKTTRHPKDQSIPEGWERGRVKDAYIWINNGQKMTPIKKDQPIPEGWVRGRLPRTKNI